MSHFFAIGGQSIGVSASASVLPMNTQDWSPLGWTGWISLQSKGLSRVFSNTTVSVQKYQFFSAQPSSQSNSHPYMTTGKTIALTRRTLVGKVMSLLLQSTSWETLGWKKHKLESIAVRNINNLSYADDTTLMAESEEELKSLLMKVKMES